MITSKGKIKMMSTGHYEIKNLHEFIIHKNELEKYLNNIETIFPFIEEVFGREWEDGYVNINLNKLGCCSYGRPGEQHTACIDVNDKQIQDKSFPENLWGCLLHETLHAFMNPIIHYKDGGANELDWHYEKEIFIFAFQSLLYLRLKENKLLSDETCKDFLSKIDNELKSNVDEKLYKEMKENLYNRYMKLFNKNSNNFSEFINILRLSPKPLIRKNTFWDDLRKIEKQILCGERR